MSSRPKPKPKVSKPIVYEHFGGKEGLYAVVVDREMSALLDGITASQALEPMGDGVASEAKPASGKVTVKDGEAATLELKTGL